MAYLDDKEICYLGTIIPIRESAESEYAKTKFHIICLMIVFCNFIVFISVELYHFVQLYWLLYIFCWYVRNFIMCFPFSVLKLFSMLCSYCNVLYLIVFVLVIRLLVCEFILCLICLTLYWLCFVVFVF